MCKKRHSKQRAIIQEPAGSVSDFKGLPKGVPPSPIRTEVQEEECLLQE